MTDSRQPLNVSVQGCHLVMVELTCELEGKVSVGHCGKNILSLVLITTLGVYQLWQVSLFADWIHVGPHLRRDYTELTWDIVCCVMVPFSCPFFLPEPLRTLHGVT